MKKLKLLLLLSIIIISQTACAPGGGIGASGGEEPVTREDFMLDTTCKLSVYRIEGEDGSILNAADAKEQAEAAMDRAFETCKELEDMLSRTKEDSDIGRINAAKGEWTSVNEETIDIIKKGIEYAELSDGAFDISIGGITELWDFHAEDGKGRLPDEDALKEAASHVDYRNIEIDGSRVRLKDPKTKIDLGGIAKGYIGDEMTAVLEGEGVVSGIINLGGNVICIGSKDDETDFTIGIEAPFSERTEMIGTVDAADSTLVTSGIYERRIEVDGKSCHHILDKKTGMPVKTDLDAVSVKYAKQHSADADAISTICLLKGYDEGMEFLKNKTEAEAVFIRPGGDIEETGGMKLKTEQL